MAPVVSNDLGATFAFEFEFAFARTRASVKP
jgi:hypothetical protein